MPTAKFATKARPAASMATGRSPLGDEPASLQDGEGATRREGARRVQVLLDLVIRGRGYVNEWKPPGGRVVEGRHRGDGCPHAPGGESGTAADPRTPRKVQDVWEGTARGIITPAGLNSTGSSAGSSIGRPARATALGKTSRLNASWPGSPVGFGVDHLRWLTRPHAGSSSCAGNHSSMISQPSASRTGRTTRPW